MGKYKTEFSKEELHKALHRNDGKAKELVDDRDKWARFKEKFEKFLKKAKGIPVLRDVIDDIITMIALVDAYVKKEYTDIPVGTIISIVAALIYVISPIDLIPDAIPIIGYLDDAAVVMLVLNLGVDRDLKEFKKWQTINRRKDLDYFEKILSEEIEDIIGEEYLAAVILTDSNTMKFLISRDEEREDYIECHIKEILVPLDDLRKLEVEGVTQIIEILNETLKLQNIRWINRGEKRAYYEPDFDGQWDRFIILEE